MLKPVQITIVTRQEKNGLEFSRPLVAGGSGIGKFLLGLSRSIIISRRFGISNQIKSNQIIIIATENKSIFPWGDPSQSFLLIYLYLEIVIFFQHD